MSTNTEARLTFQQLADKYQAVIVKETERNEMRAAAFPLANLEPAACVDRTGIRWVCDPQKYYVTDEVDLHELYEWNAVNYAYPADCTGCLVDHLRKEAASGGAYSAETDCGRDVPWSEDPARQYATRMNSVLESLKAGGRKVADAEKLALYNFPEETTLAVADSSGEDSDDGQLILDTAGEEGGASCSSAGTSCRDCTTCRWECGTVVEQIRHCIGCDETVNSLGHRIYTHWTQR